MQRFGGVTGAPLTGAIVAWITVLIVRAPLYAMLMVAAMAEGETPSGRSLCPAGLCWPEAAASFGVFLMTALIGGSLTWFVCGAIPYNGIGRPSRRLVALFPIVHAVVAVIPLGYVLAMLARPFHE